MNRVFAYAAVAAAAVLVSQAFADTITMNDGQVVDKAVVSKVGVREIEYTVNKRKVLYTVRKADVAKITYKDGSVDTFPLKERRKDGRGDGFGKPRRGKGPGQGIGPGGKRRGFRGEPGQPGRFMGRGEFNDYPERDAPLDKPYVPPSCHSQRDGWPAGQGQGPALAPPPPPPPQGSAITPPPPPPIQPATPPAKAQATTPAPAQSAPAQPAQTQPSPPPAKAQPTTPPAQPAPPTQPAATPQSAPQPVKTLPAPAPAQPATPPAR